MTRKSTIKLGYSGSLFWIIFWIIFFFPVAIGLWLLHGELETASKSYRLEYPGSPFWLLFWAVVFFPVGLVLLAINGISFLDQDLKN